ncbi:MAG TPA: DUF4404 family protein [Gemmatimonadales bacterium]|jgi:hypothetical protein|nr:DUF4404 family protein [Gemmatimonadales bacterium]
MMKQEELAATLERLHAELARTPATDPRTRELLERLQADVRSVLDRQPADESIRERLEDGVAHFEASHPALARNLAQVIDALALFGL